jgi:hypothetical protein
MNFFQPIQDNPNASAETLVKKRVSWNKGLTNCFSEEARAKISAANRSKAWSAETCAKISARHKGKIISAECRAKMSAASKGRPKSPEHRAKISAGHKNKGVGTKPLMTPNGLYPSRKAVAEAANVPFWTVDSWIKKWPQHYFYLD